MADILRGLKAGLAAGFVLYLFSSLADLISGVELPHGWKGIHAAFLYLIPVNNIVSVIIAFLFGIIGVIFAILYNKLPTNKALSKGTIFFIPFSLLIYFIIGWVPAFLAFLGPVLFPIILGLLLGFFYDKLGPKKAGSKKK